MSLVGVHDSGSVRHLVLERAEKRNAFDDALIGDLAAALEAAATDDGVRCLVLRGDGPMFSSGMDLGSLRAVSQAPERLHEFRAPIVAAWNLLESMPKPTICQIHGGCLGGAFELACAADFRVMAEEAMAGIMEVRIGLIPDVGGCSRLPALVGLGNAKELIMTGKAIDGHEAFRIGWANRIGPAAELDDVTAALLGELTSAAPRAVALAKGVLDAAAKPALQETLDLEGDAQAQLAGGEDFAEGTRAFFEKRAPQFSGR